MQTSALTKMAGSLSSRRGAALWLIGFLALISVLFSIFASTDSATRNPESTVPGSESAQVEQLLEKFPQAAGQSALLVVSRTDGNQLSTTDQARLAQLPSALPANEELRFGEPLLSEDQVIGLLTASWEGTDALADRQVVEQLRSELTGLDGDGLEIQVTGGPAFGLDVANSFAGADFTLLAVTVGIVAVLLIFTYRSPILWLIPLVVVALADRAASLLTGALAEPWNLHFDTGVLSVLVFGAGTNYALLLISRYRDELRKSTDHRQALRHAWRESLEAILSSNLTVVIALATLVLAVMDDTRGLGIACAIGLLLAAVFVLLLLPAILALCGRKVFWPLIPSPHTPARSGQWWARIAEAVTARPVVSLASVGVLLAIFATVLTGTGLGLKPTEQFRSPMESADASALLTEHFPAGESQPGTILATTGTSDAVIAAATAVPGVQRVAALSTSPDGQWERLMLVGSAEPGSAEDFAMVQAVRDAVHQVPGANALVGGPGAEAFDAQQSHLRDFLVIAPLVVAVCFIMLLLLTRSWLTALALTFVNLLSSAAALGLGALIGALIFDVSALDVQVPLLAFLFLVALGVDYTIFLTQRIKQEARHQPMRQAVVAAVSSTGAVITSAGVVLAGVFAALATLPLMVLGQLGLIVGLGVLLDTFLVRSVMVPALFTLLGRRQTPILGAQPPRDGNSTASIAENTNNQGENTHA